MRPRNSPYLPLSGGADFVRTATAGDRGFSPAPATVETFISIRVKGNIICPGSLAAPN